MAHPRHRRSPPPAVAAAVARTSFAPPAVGICGVLPATCHVAGGLSGAMAALCSSSRRSHLLFRHAISTPPRTRTLSTLSAVSTRSTLSTAVVIFPLRPYPPWPTEPASPCSHGVVRGYVFMPVTTSAAAADTPGRPREIANRKHCNAHNVSLQQTSPNDAAEHCILAPWTSCGAAGGGSE